MDILSLTTKKKKSKEEKKEKEETEDTTEEKSGSADSLKALLPLLLGDKVSSEEKEQVRVTGIWGTINEERCLEAVYSMLLLKNSGRTLVPENPEDPDSEILEYYKPFNFIISTFGGSAADMFAVYDTMKNVRDGCDIHTVGLGKVMSAGVLLLAAGTKGTRKIGPNCRIMIHGVISGQHGHLHDVENEFEEAKITQQSYIKALAAETNMTQAYLKKLIQRKTNVYIDAEEAIELGIADEML